MTSINKTKPTRRRFPIARPTFDGDLAKYQKELRSYLSVGSHKKRELIEYGVAAKVEQEYLKSELALFRKRWGTLHKDLWTAIDAIDNGEKELDLLAKKIAAGRENQVLEALLKACKQAAKSKIGDTNAANAAGSRMATPTLSALKKFRSDWTALHGVERGYKNAAATQFKVSTKTISRLAKRIKANP